MKKVLMKKFDLTHIKKQIEEKLRSTSTFGVATEKKICKLENQFRKLLCIFAFWTL